LVSSAAREFGSERIRANVIAPGFTRTPRLVERFTEDQWSRLGSLVPGGEVATTADIAAVALFLMSDLAAQVNGQVLTVDGGWSGVVRE
jgi:NAD(P)-dependent dehydrogenase (short-subunit alcohol dehydrogenase family)